ncbi:hypothetical protein DM860_017474 [Cuscuta australis]|uniref:Uncharacterized protein n=1 Tax=Cuscuta australis TaxID=267555 RepID=A0A328E0M9_9ASTE|nr:hypothetical protein DM860_017474 [Cuscuta australis]
MENSSTPDCTMHLHEDHTSMGEEIGQIGQLIHKYRSLQMKATSGAEDSSTNNGTVHVRENHTRSAAHIRKRIVSGTDFCLSLSHTQEMPKDQRRHLLKLNLIVDLALVPILKLKMSPSISVYIPEGITVEAY